MSEVKDRHSNMAVDGKPKKGGAGKGGWGKGGLEDLGGIPTKPNDPDYDSEKEGGEDVLLEAKMDKKSVERELLEEYVASGDAQEAAKTLKESGIKPRYFLRKAMIFGMERSAFEREMISQLFSALNFSLVPTDNYTEAFQEVLDKLEELSIDIPQAPEMAGKFLARAIVDEVVPPVFVKTCDLTNLKSEECVNIVTSLINEKNRIHRLAHVWGPGDLGSIKRLKEESQTILNEYLTSGDLEEADRCVRRLNVPSFHYHLVKQAIRLSITSNQTETAQKISKLLKYFEGIGLLSSEQLAKGVRCVEESLDDIKLDAPNAPKAFTEFQVLLK
eukprot:TRINITY_DN2127_c1_g1_i1.p1 TRINITY_DN2127_c1_g1~~TRINITY_DN2127_c1_g1_i1.p1  ORF type:complete len:331 (-),score=133.26 TRINITY_DN2127_c1_g1_i1:66-1058(-)